MKNVIDTWDELFAEADLSNLREQIIVEFSPKWNLNDPAHRREHFLEVEKCGHYINQKLGIFDPKHILFVAWFHDLFTWDRSNHHLMAAHWIRTSSHHILSHLSREGEREIVALACEEHRASFAGEYSNLFCELMACADRGFPGDVVSMLQRAIQYRRYRGYSEKESLEGAVKHLKEKFGSGGYARYPDLYVKVFEEELEKQQKEIDAL